MRSLHAFVVTTSCALVSVAAQNDMIGVGISGASYLLASTTGIGFLQGPSGLPGLSSLARIGGTIYTVTNTGVLAVLDPVTGVGIPLFPTTPPLTAVRGLAGDGSGNMYAIEDSGASTTPDRLYRVDVVSGSTILIGSTMPYSGLNGLVVDASGALYSWDVGPGTGIGAGLVLLDPATGVASDVNPAIGNAVDVMCLALSHGGTLYGARNSLFTIDAGTGGATLIGTGGYSDLRGIEFTGLASCTLRNGSGINPVACSCTTRPVLGSVWRIDVTPTANTVLTMVFLAAAPLPVPIPLFGGEALVLPPLFDIPSTVLGMHAVTLPANSTFIGLPLFVQGERLRTGVGGLTFQLTNGLDALLGL